MYELFNCRYNLYKTIYNHRVVQAIEEQMCDILLAVDPVFNFRQVVTDPEEYCSLTDNIVYEIEFADPDEYGENAPAIKDAQRILKRLRERQIYRFVGEKIL